MKEKIPKCSKCGRELYDMNTKKNFSRAYRIVNGVYLCLACWNKKKGKIKESIYVEGRLGRSSPFIA